MIDFLASWLGATLAYAVPYALAALGLIVCERAGVLSLTAEGFMLVGALAGIGAVIALRAPPVAALALGMAAAAAVAVLFALLVVILRLNQVVAGLAMVFFCQGLTSLAGTAFGWTSKAITGLSRIPLGPLADMPLVGRIFFNQDILVYFTVPIFAAVAWTLAGTMAGLRLRAVGESPEAADAAGVNVTLYRFLAVLAGSALIGLAGAYISVGSAKIWIQDMTSGRGWIAIALVIFARWRPWRALAGAILFGCIESLVPRIAAAGIQAPRYVMLMLPYVVTLGVMVWMAATRAGQPGDEPAALGQPHVREERR
jgi:simple sugar transport system permease protein